MLKVNTNNICEHVKGWILLYTLKVLAFRSVHMNTHKGDNTFEISVSHFVFIVFGSLS